MKINDMRRFVAMVDAGLHAPRAAESLDVPLASLYTSLERLESDVGHPILSKEGSGWRLTPAGTLLLDEARARVAAAPAPLAAPKPTGGGKAKASKGTGRAPRVKGQPKPYKKRQGR